MKNALIAVGLLMFISGGILLDMGVTFTSIAIGSSGLMISIIAYLERR